MSGYGLPARPSAHGRAGDGPSGRPRALVMRFAAGEMYTPLAQAFALSVVQIIRIVHRSAYVADPDAYWQHLRTHGHRLTLPQAQIRTLVQAALAREEAPHDPP